VQVSHSDEQLELVQQELDSIRPLLEKGYIPLTRVRALERTLSVQKAASAQWRAQIIEVTSLQRENEQNRLNTLAAFRERAANERRDIDLQIARFGPELEVATSRRHFNDLLAPHDGWVLDLSISGPDQIVSPRSTFMWIVPDTKSFIIEAEFLPKDTNALTVDHPAFVRFSGSGRRNAAVVKGRITSISPDIVLNDLGIPVKKARIAISEVDLKQSNFSTGWQHLRPGTPAEVMAVVRRRTLAEYLVEPLTAATWRAFREP
jgi:multidrug resistance efflux pump